MTATELLRKQVKKYVDKADESSLLRVNAILEIDQHSSELWHDKAFTDELDRRYKDLQSGKDKGITLEQLENSFDEKKKRKNGK